MAKGERESEMQTSQGNKGQSSTQGAQTEGQDRQRSSTLARRDSSSISPRSGDPFMLMRMLSDDLDRMAERFGFGRFPGFGDLMQQDKTGMWSPQIEVSEDDGQLMVRADLPGLKKEDVNVEISDGMIVISGERKQERQDKRKGYYRSERNYGSFSRAIPLPEGANLDDAKASFNDGVLEITVPMPQEKQKQPRQVQIQ